MAAVRVEDDAGAGGGDRRDVCGPVWGGVGGEAGDGQEAVEAALRLRPDVILMDISMPRMDGLEATRLIKARLPEVKIVILTVSDEDRTLFEAVKSGAQGYLLKDLQADEFLAPLSGVERGEAPLSRGRAGRRTRAAR